MCIFQGKNIWHADGDWKDNAEGASLYGFQTFTLTLCESVVPNHQSHVSVCLSVWKVYFGKMTLLIWMPCEVVGGVGRGMGVLDGDGYRRREEAVLGVNGGIPL